MLKSTAQHIVYWLDEIKDQIPGTIGMASTLCNAHNWATAPSVPRTDKEHNICRIFAKHIRKQLDSLTEFWYETESGLYRINH